MSHRKDLIKDFNDEQRKRLAGLIKRFLVDAVVSEHVAVAAAQSTIEPNHEEFFRNHRVYIDKLETFLVNNDGREFVPLPKWNDADEIPAYFSEVRSKDNGKPRAPLNPFYNLLGPPLHPLPTSVQLPQLCNFARALDVTHELSPWHGEVHKRLGGVMFLLTPPDPITEAAAALIFWPWHAFNDEIYHEWERCKLLGGKSIVVGTNQDGRLEVFMIGTAGDVWQCWQQNTYGGWSNWTSMGGFAKQIAVGSNADGRLEIFAIGSDDALWHRWQRAPNGIWSDWHSLGGFVKRIVVGQNQDGRLEVFARGSDNAAWHIYQLQPNGVWSNWESLGGYVRSRIAVGRNADGRLEVFIVDLDWRLRHKWQTAPNSGWSRDWLPLRTNVADMTVGNNADGRLQVFALLNDLNHTVHHCWQTTPNGGWSKWESLNGAGEGIAVVNVDGRLEVFVIGSDYKVWRKGQLVPNASSTQWSEWISLGDKETRDFAVAVNTDRSPEVFAIVTHDVVWHIGRSSGGRWLLL